MKKTERYQCKYNHMRDALRAMIMATEERELWLSVEQWGGIIELSPTGRRDNSVSYFAFSGAYCTRAFSTWRKAARAFLIYMAFQIDLSEETLPNE